MPTNYERRKVVEQKIDAVFEAASAVNRVRERGPRFPFDSGCRDSLCTSALPPKLRAELQADPAPRKIRVEWEAQVRKDATRAVGILLDDYLARVAELGRILAAD